MAKEAADLNKKRIPPARGSIKRHIFASILNNLKLMTINSIRFLLCNNSD
ncbi:hypothetical protein Acr_04g0003740 [Actinidia rufa]|uniref:Uncharacterized protein n=1 Tax=Actinidia rufa TaxID=165716 RepID=A0A7J0EHH5_9ERIC|nr:hypothetical protein Acr_04g0003740 [Actinidia rufa]